ncbi:hypothetical protein C8R44DRAFT_727214 [Mycena epipterygia]|nr:hypothetical protein C8R44DRAFT_727214 [Mycena epipterygia]
MPTAKILKRANPGTIQDKFLVGYQGWFTCANDGPPIGQGHHGWLHWLNQPLPPLSNGRPNTDLWPDTSAYDASELYPVEGLTHRDGSPAKVFSSRDPRTVRRHFHWMAEHGVDGAFLQRFVQQVDPEEAGNRDARYGGTRGLRDEVGRRVREAAETEGRVWAIMYDVSGVPAADVLRIITQDFAHLVHEERIFDSPAYLREHGRPVIAVWGFGLSDSPVPPQTARAVFAALRAGAPANDGPYIFAGVPSYWRTPGAGDAHADSAWAGLWLGSDGAVDALSPWSVGRFSTRAEVDTWAEERWAGDAERVAAHNEAGVGRKVDYVPVVLPGGSGFNLSEGKWAFNGIKRDGGKFLWAQIFNAKRLKGVRTMYGAMWDEYDEGTAFLPVVEKKRLLPESETWPFLALDEDGYDLPSDWYMRIAGFAGEGLRSERRIHDSFPSKELQDYWSARPRYEDTSAAAAGSSSFSSAAASSSSAAAGSSSSAAASSGARSAAETDAEAERERKTQEAQAQFAAWAEEQRRKEAEGEDAPPPAYSLEDEGPAVLEPVQNVAPQPVQQQAPLPQQAAPLQHQNVAPQPQPNYGARPDEAVGALAGEFARQRIGVSPPPLHPAHPGRQESGSGGAGQGYGGVERPPLHPAHPQAGRVGSQGSVERPPLHPTHPQAGRVGSHDSVGSGGGGGSVGGGGSFGAVGRVGSPEVQGAGAGAGQGQGQWPPHQWSAKPYQQQPQGYQQAQHTGGSAGSASSSSYSAQSGAQYQRPGVHEPYRQQQQHTGGSASSSSSYPGAQYQQPQLHEPRPQQPQFHQPHQQHQQHAGGSASSSAYPAGAAAYSAQGPYQQQQHTGGSAGSASSYPAPGGAQYQQPPQVHEPHRQHQQHTGGSASSAPYGTHGDGPAYNQPGARPSSTRPGQAAAAGYASAQHNASPYPSGTELAHSTSLSAKPPSSLYPTAASPPQGHSAPRPTTPGYASYPAAGGSGYPASPPPHGGPPLGHHASLTARPESARPTTPGYAAPAGPPPMGHHASLAARPESTRPTTPGYAGQAGLPHAVPPHTYSSPQHSPYATQFPSNGPPASYPGSSYNAPPTLPSPDIPGPAFPPGPMASQYGGAPYQPSPQPSGPYPGQSFPSPQQSYPVGPPQPGAPSYPPAGPSFPQGGSDNGYFYQQPPQPQFPGAGYSPQPDMYNYAQQPQGPWVAGGPPPLPHRPGSGPQPGYGQPVSYGAPGFPSASPPPTGPLGFAVNSMDKIVGRRTREQLEGGLESLTQSSTKLLNKFR